MTYQEYEAEVDRELSRQNTSRKTVYVFDLPTRVVMDAFYQKISAAEFAASALRNDFPSPKSSLPAKGEADEQNLFAL